ncbi:hypothetical protein Tco_0993427 [Tanacetum coccineum]|uniref:Uncharacterized protein n=1 Tax=Tanacetum coccineum TaxID=301880 RepID=A0ABQ5F5H9_9ASTR
MMVGRWCGGNWGCVTAGGVVGGSGGYSGCKASGALTSVLGEVGLSGDCYDGVGEARVRWVTIASNQSFSLGFKSRQTKELRKGSSDPVIQKSYLIGNFVWIKASSKTCTINMDSGIQRLWLEQQHFQTADHAKMPLLPKSTSVGYILGITCKLDVKETKLPVISSQSRECGISAKLSPVMWMRHILKDSGFKLPFILQLSSP